MRAKNWEVDIFIDIMRFWFTSLLLPVLLPELPSLMILQFFQCFYIDLMML